MSQSDIHQYGAVKPGCLASGPGMSKRPQAARLAAGAE